MSAIIFATIGDPTVYKEVKYSFQGKEERSNVSFLAIKKFLEPIPKTVAILGISVAEKLGCKDECTASYDQCKQCIVEKSKGFGVNADEYIVAPNILGIFKSKPDYYFSHVYYNSLKILENEKPNKIYLDTTHGINYMPILAKDALLLATSAYAARQEKEVSFGMFNSDPYVKDIEGPYEIHLTESIRVSPLAGLKYVTTQILNKDLNYFQSLKKEGVDFIKIHKIARGLDNGLFVYFADKAEEIQGLIKKFEADEKVDIKFEAGTIKLEYKDAKHALVHALLYVALRFKKEGGCLDLETLENFAKVYADKVTSTIIRNEIDRIKENADKITSEKKLLREIAKEEGEKRDFDQRILYAHGGLPYAGTYVYRSGEKICISYIADNDKTNINKIEEHM